MCRQSVPGTDVHLVRLFVRLPPIAAGSPGTDSPPRPLAAALLSENRAFILWGGEGGKRSLEAGARVKGQRPVRVCAGVSARKKKARPNGRAALSVMVCVIKTSQWTVDENGRIFTVIWLSTCLQYLEGLC